jgi:AraC family transcriptional regulator of arabinose operon
MPHSLSIPLHSLSPNEGGVDRKRSFAMNSFELSVLETVEVAEIHQTFTEPIFYNMIQGKKIMRFNNELPFEYLPGNTMIVPPSLSMEVQFPDASPTNPTQCVSLTIDRVKIANSLSLLNERFPREDGKLWQLQMNRHSLMFNEDISELIFKLYRLVQQNSQEAGIIAELTLTELLVLLFQNQNLSELETASSSKVAGTLADVVRFIQTHLDTPLPVNMLAKQSAMSKTSLFRAFKREFNLSPVEYINKERINRAKTLIRNHPELNISEIGYLVGIFNPNYFARIFKQLTGLSPTAFKMTLFPAR